MDLQPGQELGHFRLVEHVGSGGFCDVWLGEHVEVATHRAVVKVPRSTDDKELLRRECELLSQLAHRGIARVIDVSLTADPPYAVQEYIAGVGLRDWMAEPRDPRVAVTLFGQLLDVLEHAHERGVVHRDVKPENIIVDDIGQPHLIDFGLGLIERDPAAVEDSLRSQAVASGTPSYMSPEQRAGETVDGRTDLYAAGIVLFELVTGRYPSLVDRPGGSIADERLAAAVDRVYRGLVAPLDERYATAGAALADLRTAFEDVPLLPAAPEVAELVTEDAPSARPADKPADERVHLEYDVHGCGCLMGGMGVLWTLTSLALMVRGVSFARYPLLVGLLLLLGFSWRKKVPYGRCRYCEEIVPVEREWPRPWRCTECKQYLDDLE